MSNRKVQFRLMRNPYLLNQWKVHEKCNEHEAVDFVYNVHISISPGLFNAYRKSSGIFGNAKASNVQIGGRINLESA